MALTVAFLKSHLNEFSGTATPTVQLFIDLAGRRINPVIWGDRADDAQMFLAAHYLKMDKSGGKLGGGALKSKKVGPLAASYMVSEWMAKGSLSATTYGLEYLDLTRIVFPPRVF